MAEFAAEPAAPYGKQGKKTSGLPEKEWRALRRAWRELEIYAESLGLPDD